VTLLRHAVGLALALSTVQVSAQGAPIDVKPLPLATRRLPASPDECAVWRREQGFAKAVERHDVAAFESFLHAGTVFDVATVDAERGRDAVLKSWTGIVEGKVLALRWRPGIVTIGGEPTIAVSRGPYILQTVKDGAPAYRVGMFQSVWVRDSKDGVWRVLFDGNATTGQNVDDRGAADRWVEDQPMSQCAPG
jgi:ketosteroid isomerase-like protein